MSPRGNDIYMVNPPVAIQATVNCTSDLRVQKNACSTKKMKGSSTDPQHPVQQKSKVFRYKNEVKIGAWNVRTLSKESGNYEQLERRMIINKINVLGEK
jgi:hypothetical protein